MDTGDLNKARGTKVVNHTKTNAGLRKLPISNGAMKVLKDIKELNRKKIFQQRKMTLFFKEFLWRDNNLYKSLR